MTKQEKAIREFCGHHANWWPSTTQVQEMLALAQPEQEPVGQLLEDAFGRGQVMWFNKPKDESMLYTTPPQRTKQEPVAFASHGVINWIADKQFQHEANLYIAPQRTWVDLTRAQFAEILCDDRWQGRPELMLLQAQSKLKEKNTRGQE